MSAVALAGIEPSNDRVVPALIQSLGSADPNSFPHEAAEALALLGQPSASGASEALAAASSRADDSELRQAAVFAMGEIGVSSPAVVAALTNALVDQVPRVAVEAAVALGTLGPGASRGTRVARVLMDPALDLNRMDVEIGDDPRPNAAWALGRLGQDSPAVADVLGNALRDPDLAVAHNAADALVALGPRAMNRAFSRLSAVAEDAAESSRRLDAALALASYGHKGRAIAQALADQTDDFIVRAKLLSRMGMPSSEAQVFARRAPSRLERALIDRDTAVPYYLRAGRGFGVVRSIQDISQWGPNALEAAPALNRLLDDEEAAVRRAAAHALRAIGGSRSDAENRLPHEAPAGGKAPGRPGR